MDGSILLHKNVLSVYGLDFDFSDQNRAKYLKEIKFKIDMAIKTKVARLGVELGNLEEQMGNETIESRDGEGNDKNESSAVARIRREIAELEHENKELMKCNDLYKLIYHCVQRVCDERVFEYDLAIRKRKTDDPNDDKTRIEEYKYARDQLTSPEDVKKYVENILPFIGSIDIANMNLSGLLGNPSTSTYRYAVSIYNHALLLLDTKTSKHAIRVYTFGTYQYKADTADVIIPYEILGIVRRDSEGNVEAYSGIMPLRKCHEVEFNNFTANGDGGRISFNLNMTSDPTKGNIVVAKYTPPTIPNDMVSFFANVVAEPVVLKNAMEHNSGFIGSIEHGSGSPKYGGYKLVFKDDEDTQELIESLSIAMKTGGKITGMDTKLYGNDLRGVLSMAKFASLAAGDRMDYIEKEKPGMTQGE